MLSIFTISPENVSSVTGWAGTLVGDLMPLLVVIIGIIIGAFIIRTILHLRD